MVFDFFQFFFFCGRGGVGLSRGRKLKIGNENDETQVFQVKQHFFKVTKKKKILVYQSVPKQSLSQNNHFLFIFSKKKKKYTIFFLFFFSVSF